MTIHQTKHGKVILGDCLEVMRDMRTGSVDLVICSPPYENVRQYGELEFNLEGEEWVAWMVDVVKEAVRVCKGLSAFVVGHGKGGTRCWSAVPALLMADLHRGGVTLRNPPVAFYKRHGIPGSGGNDHLRADYEWIICATAKAEELPWSDNTACGHAPEYGPGGAMSNRHKDGTRNNSRQKKVKPSGGTNRKADGQRDTGRYVPPDLSNPGNVIVIDCGAVGGGRMGSKIVHENEAPFPEKIPNVFIRSFCPPGGTVMDIFSGSGTTAGEAVKLGRKFIAIDKRQSQVDLTLKRVQLAERKRGFLIS